MEMLNPTHLDSYPN